MVRPRSRVALPWAPSWARGGRTPRKWILASALILAMVSATTTLPIAGAGFVSTTSASGSSWTAASSFATVEATLWGWGSNDTYRLGDGTTTARYEYPKQLTTTTHWVSVGAGTNFACAVQSGGTLWCWGGTGYNATSFPDGDGRLGLGATTAAAQTTPAQAGSATSWSSVSSGQMHSCAVQTNGTLWCWGYHGAAVGTQGDGRLGFSTTSPALVPTQVGTDTNWAQVSAGQTHTCATKTDKTLWCWGNNTNGRLGDGTTTTRQTPVQAASADGGVWVSVGTGVVHTCGRRTETTSTTAVLVYCWGSDNVGQLGNGAGGSSGTPAAVGTAEYSGLAVGSDHNCAVRKSDSTLWCWGGGTSGKLGDAASTSRHSPVQENTAATNWKSAMTGADHSCGIQTDQTLWCWGANGAGQLGIGGTTSKNTPQKVLSGSGGTQRKGDAMFSGIYGVSTFAVNIS